jgi:hypothetical protein
MREPKMFRLNIHEVGYGIHDMADRIIAAATEPTIVEMTFVGENNIQKRYSEHCATQGSVELGVEYLTHLLTTHDWTYMYSDDNRYYRSGHSQAQLIRITMSHLDARGVDATALYNQYSLYENLV